MEMDEEEEEENMENSEVIKGKSNPKRSKQIKPLQIIVPHHNWILEAQINKDVSIILQN